jgi:hypothetical protein
VKQVRRPVDRSGVMCNSRQLEGKGRALHWLNEVARDTLPTTHRCLRQVRLVSVRMVTVADPDAAGCVSLPGTWWLAELTCIQAKYATGLVIVISCCDHCDIFYCYICPAKKPV